MALEFCASKDEPSGVGTDIKWRGDTFTAGTSRALEHIAERAMSGGNASKLSGAFHTFVAETVLAGCVEARKATGLSTAALSGGVFQNKLLLEKSCALLRDNGFKVLKHSLVPTNDGGVALGQAVAAMEYLKDHRGGK